MITLEDVQSRFREPNSFLGEVIKFRKEVLNNVVDFFTSLPEQEEYLIALAEMRQLRVDTLKKAKVFYIDDEIDTKTIPTRFKDNDVGLFHNNNFVMKGRMIYPVFDPKGDCMAFIGYDKFVTPKYLDSATRGYRAKHTTFYGMELLPEIYKQRYVICVEGPVCRLYLQQMGFLAIALLTSGMNKYTTTILKRVPNVFILPDNDEAGENFRQSITRRLPAAFVRKPLPDKDIDDSRKVVGNEELAEDIRRWITNPYASCKYFI